MIVDKEDFGFVISDLGCLILDFGFGIAGDHDLENHGKQTDEGTPTNVHARYFGIDAPVSSLQSLIIFRAFKHPLTFPRKLFHAQFAFGKGAGVASELMTQCVILQETFQLRGQRVYIARGKEQTGFAVGKQFRCAVHCRAHKRFARSERRDDGERRRIFFERGMRHNVQRGKNLRHVAAKTRKDDAVLQTEPRGLRAQLCRIRVRIKQRAAHQHQTRVRKFLRQARERVEKQMLSFPGDEARDAADED
jgi:hypothetical protein